VSASALLAQLRAELVLATRRGEALLITFIVPPALLAFFASVPLTPTGGQSRVAFLLPGMVALAVIAAAMVALGIGTAYERHYGVLKRLGGLPGVPATVVLAKALAVLVVEVAQLAVLVAVAVALGWAPSGDVLAVAVSLVLGTGAFAGIGLFLAGTLRAEITLALTNAMFLLFLLVGGIVVPASQLPPPLGALAPWLPAGALADSLRDAFAGSGRGFPLVVVAAWAAVALVAAGFTFRVEE
jgi:ABC-2 type transport system permease protein